MDNKKVNSKKTLAALCVLASVIAFGSMAACTNTRTHKDRDKGNSNSHNSSVDGGDNLGGNSGDNASSGSGNNGGNGGNGGGNAEHTHVWSAWSTTPATCKNEGKKTRICDGCGDVEEQKIEKLPHTYSTTECTACHTPLVASNGLTFSFSEVNKSYSVSLLYCKAEEIVIPATYEGLPVVYVNGSLYDKTTNSIGLNTTTKHIYIPEGVKNFEFGSGYEAVESISLPSTIEKIPKQGLMFVGMDTFTTIYYGGTVQEWIALEKGTMWNHGTLDTVVTSDGVRRNLNGSMKGGIPSLFG